MERELPAEIYEICDIIVKSVQPERVYLFGSWAYGTPRDDSDYDFYVVLPDGYPMRRGKAIDKIRIDVGTEHLKRPEIRLRYDVLANYKSRFSELSKFPTMMRQIADEGIVLYECRNVTR